mmetsp:Transcript_46658/g.99619  ORF Transcript_46658/g.99619 Transcript_46658/m.99619 type:complete len:310 (+) Transcript_46658:38-967(+)
MAPNAGARSRHGGRRSTVFAAAAVFVTAPCVLVLPFSFVSPKTPRLGSQLVPRMMVHAVVAPETLVDKPDVVAPTTAYVAMNRFKVREGSGPAFEQRWAQRKSSLRRLKGFQWFALLRRVQSPDPDDEYSYSSFTWWKEKEDFNAWRKGPAFKEAHGGGDIFSFLGMIINGFLTSKGPPKPCFWNGEVELPSAQISTKFEGGPGSKPDFDGSREMEAEVFVSLRRFSKGDGDKDALRASLREDRQSLVGAKGLRFSQVLSRDQEADDGADGALMSVWDSKEEYEASALGKASDPTRGEALYEGVLVLEK